MEAPSQMTSSLPGISRKSNGHEANHIWAFVGMVLGLHHDLSFRGNRTNGRKMVTGQLDFQDWRLACRRIGMHRHWQEVEPGLIYERDGPLFVFGLFFSSSHRCSFQLWMATSSRWVAFWMGFC
jgi:hypothetical protein